MPSLVKLFAFHRKWWDEFGEGMERDAGYRECGNSVDGSVWTALVWQMFSDMDAGTPGVRPFSMEIKEWSEKEVCWSEKCSGVEISPMTGWRYWRGCGTVGRSCQTVYRHWLGRFAILLGFANFMLSEHT